MANSTIPPPSAENRRRAVQLAEKARVAINAHNFEYGITLLQDCCKLDPANLIFRKALRQTQKLKFRNDLTGSPTFSLSTWGKRMRLSSAIKSKRYADALDLGEAILAKNPWHTATQLQMAQAAEGLGLGEVAVFILEQARQKNPEDRRVNLPLAQLHERLGNYTQAVKLYELASKADPTDAVSARKVKNLSAQETLERGQYEERTFSPEQGGSQTPLIAGAAHAKSPQQQRLDKVGELRAKIQSEPGSYLPYLELAKLFARDGKWEDARTILESGLAATGSHFEINLALADLEIEPFRANLRVAQEQISQNPEDPQARTAVAKLSREVLAREAAYYRQRTDRFPGEFSSHLELGIRLAKLGQPEDAIPELQQGRKDTRQRWKALFYLGLCFRAKRNWPLAKRNFEEASLALPQGDDEAKKGLLFALATGAADFSDWPVALQAGNELANMDYSYQGIGERVEQWQRRFEDARS